MCLIICLSCGYEDTLDCDHCNNVFYQHCKRCEDGENDDLEEYEEEEEDTVPDWNPADILDFGDD